MNEDQVKNALRALAEHDRAEEAPAFIEARVLAEFRARKRRSWMPWAGLMATAAALMAAILWMPQPGERQLPVAQEPFRPPIEDVVITAPDLPVQPVPSNPVPPTRRVPARAAVAAPQPQEVVTQFFPLMDVMPPLERGEIYRVTVPASTMRVVGIPVSRELWNQRVEAEVLVGEEGLARAIRFVGYEQ